MRRYWYEGNSELFIYLLDRMEYMSDCKDLLGDKMAELGNAGAVDESSDNDDDEDRAMAKAKKSWTRAKQFFQTFADQANDLWECISGPYTRATKQDMEDFIADEGDDEEEGDDDVHGHQVFDREKAMSEMRAEKELAKFYEQKAEEEDDESASADHEEKKGSDDSAGGGDDDDYREPHMSSASEDDEWVKNIRGKSRKNSLGGRGENGIKGTPRRQSFKKIGSAKKYESASEESDDRDFDDPSLVPHPTPTTKRKPVKTAIFEDSEDE